MPLNYLEKPDMALELKNNKFLVSVHRPTNSYSGGLQEWHADNLRSIKYYHSGKIIITFRTGSYKLSSDIGANWIFYLLKGVKSNL